MSVDLYVVDWHSQDIEDDTDSKSSDSSENGEGSKKQYQCNKKFMIKAFCLDEMNETVVLNIHDFTPFYYVKVPNTWTQSLAALFIRGLKGKVKKWLQPTMVNWKLVNAKPLYGFTANDKFRYIKLTFSCLAGFYGYKNVLANSCKYPDKFLLTSGEIRFFSYSHLHSWYHVLMTLRHFCLQ